MGAPACRGAALGGAGDGSGLASLLADKDAELQNLQAALGELSYEVGESVLRACVCVFGGWGCGWGMLSGVGWGVVAGQPLGAC
jgi:hypothetical protein